MFIFKFEFFAAPCGRTSQLARDGITHSSGKLSLMQTNKSCDLRTLIHLPFRAVSLFVLFALVLHMNLLL